jgi:hypothetical protein
LGHEHVPIFPLAQRALNEAAAADEEALELALESASPI